MSSFPIYLQATGHVNLSNENIVMNRSSSIDNKNHTGERYKFDNTWIGIMYAQTRHFGVFKGRILDIYKFSQHCNWLQ